MYVLNLLWNGHMRFRSQIERGLIFIPVLAFLFALPVANAFPKAGTPAPPLRLTQLFQAPSNAQADWQALRGKVVILEFWATWCEICVAELPDFNKLVASLDSKKFQFI